MLWGRKDGTIRLPRNGASRHAQPGDKIQNYVGMRTRSCELILRSICVANVPIVLLWRPVVEIVFDGEKLSTGMFNALAVRDGFSDFDDMERFWAETHPGITRFAGEMIRWKAPIASPVEMGHDVVPEARAA
jgi:hypothetical protein